MARNGGAAWQTGMGLAATKVAGRAGCDSSLGAEQATDEAASAATTGHGVGRAPPTADNRQRGPGGDFAAGGHGDFGGPPWGEAVAVEAWPADRGSTGRRSPARRRAASTASMAFAAGATGPGRVQSLCAGRTARPAVAGRPGRRGGFFEGGPWLYSQTLGSVLNRWWVRIRAARARTRFPPVEAAPCHLEACLACS
jgi:hypothetical protein